MIRKFFGIFWKDIKTNYPYSAYGMISRQMITALASEAVLAKDWNAKEDDEAWKDL